GGAGPGAVADFPEGEPSARGGRHPAGPQRRSGTHRRSRGCRADAGDVGTGHAAELSQPPRRRSVPLPPPTQRAGAHQVKQQGAGGIYWALVYRTFVAAGTLGWNARIASCRREDSPNFRKIWVKCALTVFSLMRNLLATSLLHAPAAIKFLICCSRPVRSWRSASFGSMRKAGRSVNSSSS